MRALSIRMRCPCRRRRRDSLKFVDDSELQSVSCIAVQYSTFMDTKRFIDQNCVGDLVSTFIADSMSGVPWDEKSAYSMMVCFHVGMVP